MGSLYPVAGAKIYIGPAVSSVPDDDVIAVSNFSSVTWTEVKGWQTMGQIGDSATLISEDVINSVRTLKKAGTKNAGSMNNQFIIQPTDPGQLAVIAAAQTTYDYPWRVVFNDAPPVKTSTVTVTIAAPGVFTWTGHTLTNGTGIKFATTGALPTGITAGTTYYVVSASTNTFSVASTVGGSAITTSGTQSGTHTASTVPTGSIKYFYGIVMGAQEQGGGANTARVFAPTVEINSAIIDVAATGA